MMDWKVYMSGEIHTDWRQQIMQGVETHGLPVVFTSAVTDHAASDAAGDVLGAETEPFWRDHKSSKVNGICGVNGAYPASQYSWNPKPLL